MRKEWYWKHLTRDNKPSQAQPSDRPLLQRQHEGGKGRQGGGIGSGHTTWGTSLNLFLLNVT